MDTTNQQLRLAGYSAADGHINCNRGGRWSHERTGILQITVSRDTPAAPPLVNAIIAEIDEPRALMGRDRWGGAVLLFRVDLGNSNQTSALALRTGEEIG